MHFVNFKLQICFPVHNCPFSNLLAANGLSKSFADGKSTGDSRFSGTMGCCHWRKIVTKHSRPGSFFLPTGNEAPQGARYSRQESIEVRLLVPKGLLSVRHNWKFVTLFFQHNSLFMCLNILCSRVSRKNAIFITIRTIHTTMITAKAIPIVFHILLRWRFLIAICSAICDSCSA